MDVSKEKRKKIEEIAQKFNTSIDKLLAEYGDIDKIIEKYESGNFRLLNE